MIVPYNRRELYIAALSDNSLTIPDYPYSREEIYLAKINGASVTLPDAPVNRYETYLAKLAGENVQVPIPASRLESFLYNACGGDVQTPTPVSREEMLWAKYVESNAGDDITDQFVFTNNRAIFHTTGKTTGTTGTKANLNFVDVSAYKTLRLTRIVRKTESTSGGLAFYTDEDETKYDSGVARAVGDEDGYAIMDVPVPATAKYVRTTYWIDTKIAELDCAPFSCIGIK